MKTYKAPWSTSLKVMSAVLTVILIVVPLGIVWQNRATLPFVGWLPLILLASGLFTIRGYSVSSNAISVHRLFWQTHVPLAGLQSARFEPDIMRKSIRLFGNGGLFSFCGLFRNSSLGSYRAYVTDLHRTVVLHFPKRAVVLSPDEPEAFIRNVHETVHHG